MFGKERRWKRKRQQGTHAGSRTNPSSVSQLGLGRPRVQHGGPEQAGCCLFGERNRRHRTLSLSAIDTKDEAVSVSLAIIERNCLQSSLMGCPVPYYGLST